jgi:hypothetical protein
MQFLILYDIIRNLLSDCKQEPKITIIISIKIVVNKTIVFFTFIKFHILPTLSGFRAPLLLYRSNGFFTIFIIYAILAKIISTHYVKTLQNTNKIIFSHIINHAANIFIALADKTIFCTKLDKKLRFSKHIRAKKNFLQRNDNQFYTNLYYF